MVGYGPGMANPATQTFTRRQFLEYQAIMGGTNLFLAKEAVASTAIEHPEWDMDEEMTWAEWLAREDQAS